MTSLLLQSEHDGGQFLIRNLLSMAFMADIKVLAKQTHEIAVCEKYGAGAMFAYQWRFLAKMGVVTGNPGLTGGFAYTNFTGKPVNAAFARAKLTWAEKLASCFYLLLQQPFFKGSDICGLKRFHFAQRYTFETLILAVNMTDVFLPRRTQGTQNMTIQIRI